MEVFIVPIGPERYELYCEQQHADASAEPAPPAAGVLGRLKQRFNVMLREAEERRHAGPATEPAEKGWAVRVQERVMAWVAERIAEQRLLWTLRRETAVVAAHPQDMTFEQVQTLIHRVLRRDYDRHRRWLVIDSLLLIISGVLTLVPGPNLVAYYFAFRVVGHWLSMRGAMQGLTNITWSGRPCPPLTELRELPTLQPNARDQRIHDISARLRLQHLSTFYERVAI